MPSRSTLPAPNVLRAFQRNQRGAAMLEFVVVLTPLLLLFLCTIELTRFAIGSLMLQRSAGMAVRACAVMKDQPLHCDANSDVDVQSGDQDAQILLAAKEALKPLPPTSLAVQSAACLTDTNNVDGPQKDIGGHLVQTRVAQSGWDSVTVQGRFHCIVPLASAIVCGDTERPGSPFGVGERTRALTAAARYGHQGARYDCWFAKAVTTPFGNPGNGPELDSDLGNVDPWEF